MVPTWAVFPKNEVLDRKLRKGVSKIPEKKSVNYSGDRSTVARAPVPKNEKLPL